MWDQLVDEDGHVIDDPVRKRHVRFGWRSLGRAMIPVPFLTSALCIGSGPVHRGFTAELFSTRFAADRSAQGGPR
jgi:hypothetical protein